jgi:hypothetical protein
VGATSIPAASPVVDVEVAIMVMINPRLSDFFILTPNKVE